MPFDFQSLRRRLEALAAHERAVAVVLPTIDSTSQYLRAQWPTQAAAGAAWSVCVAEAQTDGRGRHGHQWRSEAGAGLWFSCALPVMNANDHAAPPLSLVVTSELIRVLNLAGFDSRLKWPNDLWRHEKKLGGVLVEQLGVGASRYWLIGVGMNWRTPAALPEDKTGVVSEAIGLFDEADQPLADQPSVDREALAEQLIMTTIDVARNPQAWPQAMRQANRWHALAGRRVQLWESGQARETGRVIEIKVNGELAFQPDHGQPRLIGGSASVRVIH